MLRRLLPALLLLVAAPFATPPTRAFAAGPDDNVEWFGASHIDWQDRRPLCPVAGEAFAVRFQVYRGDITSARVNVTALGASGWVDAARVDARGPYDVWQAAIPATADDTLSYWIELTDGADTDYLGPGGLSDGPPAAGWLLDFAHHSHAPVGATPVSGGGAVFKVWAPTRTTANVAGSFNGWSSTANPMAKVGEYWVARVPSGVPDRAQYKFVFNGSHWNTDPRARGLNPVNQYNAFIENPFRYAWRTGDFIPPTADELIVYQLHVGTFAGRNDPVPGAVFPARYGDVAQRVGHLAELGVNAVMLNPVNEFPGDESAGYNPISMWAPEWKYGTPDGFKTLVDSLHSRGIAVILDVVWNHFSSTDNFLWNYDGSQQWFDTPAIETPWGSQADFDKAAVRDYFAHSAHHWLEEYRLDGFRFDATDFMNIGAQAAAGWGLMQRFNDEFDGRWAGKFAVAEQLPNDAWVTKPTSAGGAGFDAQYQDPFTDNLRQEVLDAAFGDPEMWRIRNIVLGSGPDISGQKAFNYFELHDEAWPSSGGQRFVKNVDTTAPHDDLWARGRVKLAQGLVMFSPGIPAMLMGSEWLEDTDFGTGSGNRIDWSKKTTYADHFAYFKDIIRLRRLLPAFRAGAPVHVFHLNEAGNVIAFRRWDDQGRPFVVIANFSNNDYAGYRIGVPLAGGWRELVNSQSAAYGGSGLDNAGGLAGENVPYDGFNQSITLQLGRMAFAVLGAESVLDAGDAPTAPAGGLRLTRVAPLPVRGAATVEFVLPEAGEARLELFDLGGRRVATLAEGPFRAGVHRVRWEGRGEAGALPAGLYFVRLLSGGQARSQAVPVLR